MLQQKFRIQTMAAIVLLALLLSISASAAGPGGFRYGDVNADTKVDAADALAVLQYTVSLRGLSEDEFLRADVNVSQTADATDALLILQHTVELIASFPAESIPDERVELPWEAETMVYAQNTPASDPGPVRTTYQNGGFYQTDIDLPIDSIMIYINHSVNVDTIPSWKKNTDKAIWVMLPAFRDGDEYFTLYPERMDTEREQYPDGSFGGVMPTANYTEFKWGVIQQCLDAGVEAIVLEEPITFFGGVYSECFRQAWKEYYGAEWSDPASSPQARYQASKLVEHMAVTMLRTLGERIKERAPDVLYYIANHNAYRAIGDFTCINSAVANLECVDGMIGQTWSNTSMLNKPYGGETVNRPFQNNYIEYANAAAVLGDKTLFALCDPLADYNDDNYARYKELWQEQLAAQLLCPEIHHFQDSIWTGRHFGPDIPQEYKSAQLAVMQAINDLSGKESTLYAGTPGIAVAMSDTMTWVSDTGGAMPTATARDGAYGLTLPLLEKGIPITSVCLDRLSGIDDLEGVKLLLVSYDAMPPRREEANRILAQWVREGGVMLLIGGRSEYDNIQGEWWSASGVPPMKNLLNQLGLEEVALSEYENFTGMTWCGPEKYQDGFGGVVPYHISTYAYTLKGTGAPLILSDDELCFGMDFAVDQGRLIAVGLPSAYFSSAAEAPAALRSLTAYAMRYTDTLYHESNVMAIQRGDYLIAHAFDQEQTLEGSFVDLFDGNLSLLSAKTIPEHSSVMLLDVSDQLGGSTPRLLFTGGTLEGSVAEEAESTVWTVTAPTNAVYSTRLAGNGNQPQSVTAVNASGKEIRAEWSWDEATESLLVQAEGTAGPVTLRVEWSSGA